MKSLAKTVLCSALIYCSACAGAMPPRIKVAHGQKVPVHMCEPLTIGPVGVVPKEVEAALWTSVLYWTAHTGAISFLVTRQIDYTEYHGPVSEDLVTIKIMIGNTRYPWAETRVHTDSNGCVKHATIVLSRDAVDAGEQDLTGLLGHEMGQLLGLENPHDLTAADIRWLRKNTGGLDPVEFEGVPTLRDLFYILEREIQKLKEAERTSPPSP